LINKTAKIAGSGAECVINSRSATTTGPMFPF
jgi:hypothetical protein